VNHNHKHQNRYNSRDGNDLDDYVNARQTRTKGLSWQERLDMDAEEATRTARREEVINTLLNVTDEIDDEEPFRPNVLIRREDVMGAFYQAIRYNDHFDIDRRYKENFEDALDKIIDARNGEKGLNKLGRRRSRHNPSKQNR
jgi:hypothetical protein